jgi:hypothetical protein
MRTSSLISTVGGLLACTIFLLGMTKEPVESMKVIHKGPWANKDYNEIENKYAKIRFFYNNKWITNKTTTAQAPLKKGSYTIIDGWEGDNKESTYYKVARTTDDRIKRYELYRFSGLYGVGHFGNVLEIVSSKEDYPTVINPNDSTYSILYRTYSGRIARSAIFSVMIITFILISGI